MIDKLPPCALLQDAIHFSVQPNADGTTTVKAYCQLLPCEGEAEQTGDAGIVEEIVSPEPPYLCLGKMLAPHCIERDPS